MTQRVVVIGAGIGGLTAAALLAKWGRQVTVLEAHVYPGGCAGTFYHRGYRFDAGATLAGGFAPGGPHHMVGGFPQTSIFRARGPRTGLPNALFVGDSVFPGQSTAGVTLSGLRVARQLT